MTARRTSPILTLVTTDGDANPDPELYMDPYYRKAEAFFSVCILAALLSIASQIV